MKRIIVRCLLIAFLFLISTFSGCFPKLVSIYITPPSADLTVGEANDFEVHGIFSDGSDKLLLNATWQYSGNGGSIAPSYGARTTFTAYEEGEGRLWAYDSTGKLNDSAVISVEKSSTDPVLVRIVVSPNSWTMNEGTTKTFTATGYNQYDEVFSINPTWSTTGGIGSVSPSVGTSTTLTASSVDTTTNGKIKACVGLICGEADVTVNAELAQDITLTLPGGIPLNMTLIPAGTFMMGSPEIDYSRHSEEIPQHQVTISQPFYMGTFELTQEQWVAVMGNNPSNFNDDSKNPVEQVSWNDCQEFIQELNTLELGTFRLPTEAEWEYACRAGSTTRFPWGEDFDYSFLDQYAWHYYNSLSMTHPVGQKEPNGWGLYDVHGNVYEWCGDWFGWYSLDSQTDPSGPATGTYRIRRGGSIANEQQYCRSAYRSFGAPDSLYWAIGLRLVKIP